MPAAAPALFMACKNCRYGRPVTALRIAFCPPDIARRYHPSTGSGKPLALTADSRSMPRPSRTSARSPAAGNHPPLVGSLTKMKGWPAGMNVIGPASAHGYRSWRTGTSPRGLITDQSRVTRGPRLPAGATTTGPSVRNTES